MQTAIDTPLAAPKPQTHLYTASDLLELISAVREHDPGAASHVLVGLLRMAANGHATAVEQTSMRIAGIAELVGKNFVLTDVGCSMLNDFGDGEYIQSSPRATHQTDQKIVVVGAADPLAEATPEPIARLRIAERDYVIGEIESLGMLAFRLHDGGDWAALTNTVEQGWSAIAAEIIEVTFDTTREYIRMHMIQRRDIDHGADTEAFDLYGFEWRVRLTEGKSEVRLGDQSWQTFDKGDLVAPDQIKFIAVEALLSVHEDPRAMFGKDIDAWARRIAAGASVMPAFNL